jgi:hypothetical protein
MALNVPNDQITYQHSPFQSPSKFTQIGIFWFENKPSGNLGEDSSTDGSLFENSLPGIYYRLTCTYINAPFLDYFNIQEFRKQRKGNLVTITIQYEDSFN